MNTRTPNSLTWLLRVAACCAVIRQGGVCAGAGDSILVLKSRELAPYDQAVAGLTDKWEQAANALPIHVGTLGVASETPEAAFRADPTPLAIVTVGTEATRWAIANTRVPVVFCMVANAQPGVMANLTIEQRARVHGVSLDIPAETQLRRIVSILPAVKRVGVLYDPKKSTAAVEEMTRAAEGLGLQMVKQQVNGESAVPEATASIVPRIDLLWSPVDSTVFSSRSAQFVLMQMLQHKVPVMGFSENMVKAGALLGPRVNYEEIGSQTAELLRSVLDGTADRVAPVQPPRNFSVVVNARVSKLVDDPIPQSQIRQVSFVNEQ